MKKLIKELLPPFIVKLVKGKRKDWGWFGNIATWEEAEKMTSGYDADYILEKKKQSFRKIKNGEVIFELDTILYPKKLHNYPLLFSLSWIALQKKQELSILDFGGSLGSSYYWVKDFLNTTTRLNWNIIEQGHIVKAGQDEFETEALHFFGNFDACHEQYTPNVLLISGVLQCLGDRQFLVDEINKRKYPFIILDRTPYFSNENKQGVISIQKLNETVYGKETTLPCRIFNKTDFISDLENAYEIVLDSPNFENLNYDYDGENFYFRFVLLKRKN